MAAQVTDTRLPAIRCTSCGCVICGQAALQMAQTGICPGCCNASHLPERP